MADIAFFLGCAAILGISVVGTYIMVLLMDCLSRPAEHRRQLALQQQHKSDNEIRQQFLEALFPPKKYEAGQIVKDDHEIDQPPAEVEPCAICIEHFKENDLVSAGHECSHQFHRPCLMKWAKKHNDCPVCRKALWKEDNFSAKSGAIDTSSSGETETQTMPISHTAEEEDGQIA